MPARRKKLLALSAGFPAYGARHGDALQTSTTAPFDLRNSDFCARAAGVLRGRLCGSDPSRGGVLVVGGVGTPLSQTTSAEPSNGSDGIEGMPKYGSTSE